MSNDTSLDELFNEAMITIQDKEAKRLEALKQNPEGNLKFCSECQSWTSLTNFHQRKDRGSSDRYGRVSKCKSCCIARAAKYYHSKRDELNRKAKIRNYQYRHATMTEEEATRLVDNRQGSCEICGVVAELMVDHCHVTGMRRGFLCRDCNFALGLAKDSLAVLQKAIDYLIKYRGA